MKLVVISAILMLVAIQVHSDPQSLLPEEVTKQLHTATQIGQVVKIDWNAPIINSDGTALTDLAGYKLYYGRASGDYDSAIDVGNSTSFVLSDLTLGETYFFALKSYDLSGNESAFSDEKIGRVLLNAR